ncbi:hypothetical protein ACFY36_40670 [Actinoplanes sp. NPDC000266]
MGLLLLSIASLSLLLVDRFAFRSEMPSRFPDERGAVSLGVRDFEVFASQKAANRPYFNFCPVAGGLWKVRFNWQVRVGSDPAKFLGSSPTVVVSIPRDASAITAEVTVDQVPGTEKLERGEPLTAVEEDSTGDGARRLLQLRPTGLAYSTDGPSVSDTAYFGVHFLTKSLDRGRNGLAKRYFKISLGQRPPGTQPIPSSYLPEYPEPGSIEFISCSSDDGRYADLDKDSLHPAPDESLERGKLIWGTFDASRFSVSGTVGSGPLADVAQDAGWFAANSFAAAMGAVYGAGISPPTPGNTGRGSVAAAPGGPPRQSDSGSQSKNGPQDDGAKRARSTNRQARQKRRRKK